MPEKSRQALHTYVPIISLVLGVLTLLSVFFIWRWAHAATDLIDYARSLCQGYHSSACDDLNGSRFGFWIWFGLVFLIAQAVLYLAAYPALKAGRKHGWNLLFYGALLNIVYSVVYLFSDYGTVGNFVLSLVGSAVGLYLLFQVRSYYMTPAVGAKTGPGKA